jgi:protoporphyrinogen oxidase
VISYESTTEGRRVRVGILGSSFAGLACAYYLAKAGHVPVVLEPGDQLGRGGPQLDVEGSRIDGGPCAIRAMDTALCGLLADLELAGRIHWRPQRAAVLAGGMLRPIRCAGDFLGLAALPWRERLRAAAGLVYTTELKTYALELDDIAATEWLPRVFGAMTYERVWRPLLERRFGEYLDEIPAYWAWRLLGRLRHGEREVLGYLRGGYSELCRQLRRAIESRGGEVRLASPLSAVETRGERAWVELEGGRGLDFDALICSLAPAQVRKLARGPLAGLLPPEDPPYLDSVTAAVVTRRPLGSHYQTVLIDPSTPFQLVTDATRLLPGGSLGGRHVTYMTYYVSRSHTAALSDELVCKQALETLARLRPDFRDEVVERTEVLRRPDVEPVHTLGALRRRPAPRLGDSNVFLCSSAQAYPRACSWDSEVTLARETWPLVARDAH